jgi:hypothetical protein
MIPKRHKTPKWRMIEMLPADAVRDARHLRLDTLVRLRWLAITGQLPAGPGLTQRRAASAE